MTLDPLLHLVIAVSLALLLLAAAWHKFRDGVRFAGTLGAYELLPPSLLGPIARGLPVIEVAVAAALLLPATRPLAAVATAVLLGIYGIAMLINLLRGRAQIDCGCGGTPQPLSAWLVVRNLALMAAALALTLPVPPHAIGIGGFVTLLTLIGLLAITHVTLEQLVRNQAALKGWDTDHG